ncbi:MAG: methylenetetrahydrofolate--tRNA-(uracil(54)-C(5))-methyltransferase (FADH(2)-oxidizing) TrmFO [Acidobacteria bacterium]|nr:methylenetetrahydrofolate--tRNA-(uracil(54)-C(5))-methyltransferase (FADH(2)-oxidizing) TrmFO [Acidobacteriota bacterium]MCB9398342.1 methylenetetrahydrofolate--tRNA-(uracil(54)-C(5))-methyltransferase (FADH(2)-oxidizing) TrmFO [Acidobacteriota bacterium]
MTEFPRVTVIGAGLAGSEAAYQLAKRGFRVRLFEMRPSQKTDVHQSDQFAELVCSNSFRSDQMENPVGLIKREMAAWDSLIIKCARAASLPAGGALAVDREAFAGSVTQALENHPNIEIVREEFKAFPNEPAILAAGPLCSPQLHQALHSFLGDEALYFYDSIAPVVELDSLDLERMFFQSRYEKGSGDDYLNLPLNQFEYLDFYQNLVQAERVMAKSHEKMIFFEACLPIEVMADRGVDTLRFGPMKPVGLVDPRTGQSPYAVIQFRQDNFARSLWNMVGFQTQLKWGEQARVFKRLPGMADAQFVRYGMIHRNTYVDSSKHLLPTFQFRARPGVFLAGQICGVEGYVESAASGLMAGVLMSRNLSNQSVVPFPAHTAMGSLGHYVAHSGHTKLNPTNVNFGIMAPEPFHFKGPKRLKKRKLVDRAIAEMLDFARDLGEPIDTTVLAWPEEAVT